MRRNLSILIILLFILNESCNNDELHLHSKIYKNFKSDTFIREFNPYFADSSQRKFKQDAERQVNLLSLENGYKGFQLRIWRGYSLVGYEQILVLKDTNSSWNAQFRKIYYEHIDPNDKKKIKITSEVKDIFPRSGWRYLISQLSKADILDIPDFSDDYSVMDGDGVTVEYADSNHYRIYSYFNPHFHADTSVNARKIMDILNLVEREFGLNEFARAKH